MTGSSNQLEIVFLSEGKAPRCGLGFSGKPAWDGVFPRPQQQGQARPRPVRPLLDQRTGAPHGRGDGGGSDPFLTADAVPARVKGDRHDDTLALPSGAGSLHSAPAGRPPGRHFALTVDGCRFVWLCNLMVALCVLVAPCSTDGPQAERGRAGACTQPDISDREHGQLAAPLDGPGGRVSRVERSQDSSANVLEGPAHSFSKRGI